MFSDVRTLGIMFITDVHENAPANDRLKIYYLLVHFIHHVRLFLNI